MYQRILLAFIILKSFVLIINQNISLEINKSKRHEDQTGKLTPLVITLKCPDIDKKIKNVDLICVVDISGSMYGTKLELVKQSLEYLVSLMDETDNFALVTFDDTSYLINNFTQMTEDNKSKIIKKIENLTDKGGTNITSGLEKGLSLFTQNYSSGEQVASMILLSDGMDIYYGKEDILDMFNELLNDTNKTDYAFTLHTFGYGLDHDASLMTDLSKIKDGGYFPIEILANVKKAFLKIYGALSTVYHTNLELTIQSNFAIKKIYGIKDMYRAYLKNGSKGFYTKKTHVIFGKKYKYVFLVDVPENTPIGTEILNATISKLGIKANYLWNKTNSSTAYEEYIRCICVTYFEEGYNNGTEGISIIKNGLIWIQQNYVGNRNWEREFNGIIDDLNNLYNFGKANILSKIRELTTNQIGINYKDENSYQIKLIDNSNNLNTTNYTLKNITNEDIINIVPNITYYYFHLKEGFGSINNIPFSGICSTFIVYSNDINSKINITSISPYMEFYYYNKTKNRIQSRVDFNRPGKFIYKTDFPFDFYSRIDGNNDITFNVEFLKFDSNATSDNSLEIIAYIVDDTEINNIEDNPTLLPNYSPVFRGSYDDILKIGKIILNKDVIYKSLDPNAYNNYLYVIVNKNSNSNIIYNKVEGQFLFVSMDSSIIPENYTIFSDYEPGEKLPHSYIIKMEPNKNVFPFHRCHL